MITPYKGNGKPKSQTNANRAHAKLRGPGERANAQLKYWQILRSPRSSPDRAGRLAKAIHSFTTTNSPQNEKGSLNPVAADARGRASCEVPRPRDCLFDPFVRRRELATNVSIQLLARALFSDKSQAERLRRSRVG